MVDSLSIEFLLSPGPKSVGPTPTQCGPLALLSHIRDLRDSLRRVHTTNDVTMTETLKLVECGLPRSSITDRYVFLVVHCTKYSHHPIYRRVTLGKTVWARLIG